MRQSMTPLLGISSILLLVGPSVMASRIPAEAMQEGGWMPFSDAAALRAMIMFRWHGGRSASNEEQDNSVVMFKFIVPPGECSGFKDAWKQMSDETMQEKGMIMFDLKKSENDNFMFFEYGQWKEQKDFLDHFESKHMQDFADYCAGHDIVWMMSPLQIVVEDPEMGKGGSCTDEKCAHIMTRYFVPGDKHQAFMDLFKDTAEKTWQEPGNRNYHLQKSMTDNLQFCSYGTWDTMDDFVEHYGSDHVHSLRQFAKDNDIVWMLTPLRKIGDQPEF